MKKIIKNNIKTIFAFILGLIISGTTVYAATIIFSADQISFDPTGTDLVSTDVQTALTELYNKAKTLPPTMNKMCPGCKYVVTTTQFTYGSGAEALPSAVEGKLKKNWEDAVVESGWTRFLGVIIDEDTHIAQRVFACGIKDGFPFCIEGLKNGSKYEDNKTLLGQDYLYANDNCTMFSMSMECDSASTDENPLTAATANNGGAVTSVQGSKCYVYSYGAGCDHETK